jgi:hypothetical protein
MKPVIVFLIYYANQLESDAGLKLEYSKLGEDFIVLPTTWTRNIDHVISNINRGGWGENGLKQNEVQFHRFTMPYWWQVKDRATRTNYFILFSFSWRQNWLPHCFHYLPY